MKYIKMSYQCPISAFSLLNVLVKAIMQIKIIIVHAKLYYYLSFLNFIFLSRNEIINRCCPILKNDFSIGCIIIELCVRCKNSVNTQYYRSL